MTHRTMSEVVASVYRRDFVTVLRESARMPEFAYTARSSQGRDSSGTISAGSRREAIALLADKSLFPLRVQAQADAGKKHRFTLRRRVKTETLADAFTQLSDLLSNGVPLLEALDILANQSVDQQLSNVMADVRAQVADGTSLETAMAQHPAVFSDLTVSMVRAGLEGAFLEEALERVASFLSKQDALRARVVGAMTYPAILGIVGVGVTIFLVTVVVPMFQGFFDRLERSGSGLPTITVVLLGVSNFLVNTDCSLRLRSWCRWSRAALCKDRSRSRVSRSLEIEIADRRSHLSRCGRLALLPSFGNAVA